MRIESDTETITVLEVVWISEEEKQAIQLYISLSGYQLLSHRLYVLGGTQYHTIFHGHRLSIYAAKM
jgi:hypothetical protein